MFRKFFPKWGFFFLVDCKAKDGGPNSKLHPVKTRLFLQVITAVGRSFFLLFLGAGLVWKLDLYTVESHWQWVWKKICCECSFNWSVWPLTYVAQKNIFSKYIAFIVAKNHLRHLAFLHEAFIFHYHGFLIATKKTKSNIITRMRITLLELLLIYPLVWQKKRKKKNEPPPPIFWYSNIIKLALPGEGGAALRIPSSPPCRRVKTFRWAVWLEWGPWKWNYFLVWVSQGEFIRRSGGETRTAIHKPS